MELDPGEATVTEAGCVMYMDDGIEMETIFGDGSQSDSGMLGALVDAGKRPLTGESLFMTVLLNSGSGKKRVAFGLPIRARSFRSISPNSAATSSRKRTRFLPQRRACPSALRFSGG